VLCCYFSIRFALFHNDIRASCNICNHICLVTPLCTLVWYMVTWVSRVYTQQRLHDFLMVQLFYNSCAQIHPSYSPGGTTVHRHVTHFLAQACILAPPGEYDWMYWIYLQLNSYLQTEYSSNSTTLNASTSSMIKYSNEYLISRNITHVSDIKCDF